MWEQLLPLPSPTWSTSALHLASGCNGLSLSLSFSLISRQLLVSSCFLIQHLLLRCHLVSLLFGHSSGRWLPLCSQCSEPKD